MRLKPMAFKPLQAQAQPRTQAAANNLAKNPTD
jgi:hypothetical protein